MTVRIAMWSGPRNISTAMMRAWENRVDTTVVDEPFYAYYLAETGLDHPGRDDVIAAQPADWRTVVAGLTGPAPNDREIYFQKHMAQHLLPGMGRDWLRQVTNAILIRDPAEVVASYKQRRPGVSVDPEELGYSQQMEIFERIAAETGSPPPVLDARDVLEDPRRMLGLLCDAVGVPFTEAMLSWPPGRRASDGVWAPHWYAAVEQSTGFAPYRASAAPLDPAWRPLAEACAPFYRRLYEVRLR